MVKEFLQGRRIRHPLHPLIVHLPVGLWTASFILDITYLFGGNPTVATTSRDCILIGVISALPAFVTGLAEFFSIPKASHPRRLALAHMGLNASLTLIHAINLSSRSNAPGLVTGSQFILSIFSIMILGMTTYLGGLLIYDYGIGFKPQLRGPENRKNIERIGKAA